MVFSSMIKALILCTASLTLLATPSSAQYSNHLLSGLQLRSNHALIEGDYFFVMQEDCNLVLYELDRVIWSTQTENQGSGCYLSLEHTGNLIIFDNHNSTVWQSNTYTGIYTYYILVLQKDRNVVLYGDVLWGTSTHKDPSNAIVIAGAHNGAMEIAPSGAEKNKVNKMGKLVEVTGNE